MAELSKENMESNPDLEQGIAAARRGEIQQAITLLVKGLAANPLNLKGWLWLARVYSETEKKKECYVEVLKIDPQNHEAKSILAEFAGNGSSSAPKLNTTQMEQPIPDKKIEKKELNKNTINVGKKVHLPWGRLQGKSIQIGLVGLLFVFAAIVICLPIILLFYRLEQKEVRPTEVVKEQVFTPVVTPAPVELFEGQISFTGIDNNVYILRGDNSKPVQVTSDGNVNKIYSLPHWSPDGKMLAFLEKDASSSSSKLILHDLRKNSQEVLLEGVGDTFDWSPDGTSIIYDFPKAMFDNLDGNGIWILNLKTRSVSEIIPKQLHKRPDGNPAIEKVPIISPKWSPDGKWIKFCWFTYDGYPPCYLHEVLTRKIYPLSILTETKYFQFNLANWSPDSQKIVFTDGSFGDPSGLRKLYISSTTGENILQIFNSFPEKPTMENTINSKYIVENLLWAPDKKKIIFGLSPDGTMIVNPDGSSPRLLTDDGYPLAWSPTGKQILLIDKNVYPETNNLPNDLKVYDMATGKVLVIGSCLNDKYHLSDFSWGPIP